MQAPVNEYILVASACEVRPQLCRSVPLQLYQLQLVALLSTAHATFEVAPCVCVL